MKRENNQGDADFCSFLYQRMAGNPWYRVMTYTWESDKRKKQNMALVYTDLDETDTQIQNRIRQEYPLIESLHVHTSVPNKFHKTEFSNFIEQSYDMQKSVELEVTVMN